MAMTRYHQVQAFTMACHGPYSLHNRCGGRVRSRNAGCQGEVSGGCGSGRDIGGVVRLWYGAERDRYPTEA